MQATLTHIRNAIETILEAVALVVTLTEINRGAGGGGEKRAEAIAQLRELVPPDTLPAFIASSYDIIAGFVIDAVVAFFNRTGFFTKP